MCVCGGWGARDRELVGRSVGCVEGLPRLTCATAPASASGHEGCAEVNGETGKQATPNSATPTPLDAEKGGKQQRSRGAEETAASSSPILSSSDPSPSPRHLY